MDSWRRSGWSPPGAFASAVFEAYWARKGGAPEAVVHGIVAEYVVAYGHEVVGEAFRAVEAACRRAESRAIRESDPRRR